MNGVAGTMTVTPSMTTISGLTSGDDIVREGDRDAVFQGFGAWLPLVRTGLATPFMGQDRSIAPELLAGYTFDGAGGQKLETIVRANTLLSRSDANGGKKRVVVCNIEDHSDIAISLGSNVVAQAKDSQGYFGFDAVEIRTPRGTMPMIGSLRVKKGEFYILRPDTWVLKSLKKVPHMVDDDGLTMTRGTSTDDVTWRLRAWLQLGCFAPAYNLHGEF